MLNRQTLIRAGFAILLIPLIGCANDEFCDSGALQRALDSAASGDIVQVGNCRITGAFEVPSGVTLAGHGRGFSVIRVPDRAIGLKLLEGPGSTEVIGLTIEAHGIAAIASYGAADIHIEQVDILASRGVGIAIQDSDSVVVSQVAITGPIDETNAQMIGAETDHWQLMEHSPTHGLVLFGTERATVSDLAITGMALFGSLTVDTASTWVKSTISSNLGTGLMVERGSVEMTGVQVCDTLQGVRLLPAYGLVASDTDHLQSDGLTVCDGRGVGLLHDGATGRHNELRVTGNRNAGVWVQNTNDFTLSGPSSRITDNALAGIVIQSSSSVTLSDASIENSILSNWFADDGNNIEVGDGIQLRDSVESIRLENLQLVGNHRANLLVDVGEANFDGITFERVRVQASPEGSYGAIGQSADGLQDWNTGWDIGIERDSLTEARDIAAMHTLDPVTPLASGRVPVSMPNLPSIIGPNN